MNPWERIPMTPEERAWAVIAAASDTDGSETAEIIASALRAAVEQAKAEEGEACAAHLEEQARIHAGRVGRRYNAVIAFEEQARLLRARSEVK